MGSFLQSVKVFVTLTQQFFKQTKDSSPVNMLVDDVFPLFMFVQHKKICFVSFCCHDCKKSVEIEGLRKQ